jgi:hypothetical protein
MKRKSVFVASAHVALAACAQDTPSSVDGLTEADQAQVQWLCGLLEKDKRSRDRFVEFGVTMDQACSCIAQTFEDVSPGQRVDGLGAINFLRSELGDDATPPQVETLVDGFREQEYSDEPVDRQTAIRIVQFRVIEEVFDQFEVRLETGAACEYAPPR